MISKQMVYDDYTSFDGSNYITENNCIHLRSKEGSVRFLMFILLRVLLSY